MEDEPPVREAQSTALWSTPEKKPLYAGETIRTPSAASIRPFMSTTGSGWPAWSTSAS